MLGWSIFWGYFAVWLLYGWRLTVHLLDRVVRRELEIDPLRSAADIAAEERAEYLAAGFGLALFWPLVAPARCVYRVASASGGGWLFRTPVEREELDRAKAAADRAELVALRKLARQHGLPMPEGDA